MEEEENGGGLVVGSCKGEMGVENSNGSVESRCEGIQKTPLGILHRRIELLT